MVVETLNKIKLDLMIKVVNISLVIFLPVMGWLANTAFATLRSHDERIIRLEESRPTRQDLDTIWRAISDLPKESPPPWFLRRVEGLENQISQLSSKSDNNYRELLSKLDKIN